MAKTISIYTKALGKAVAQQAKGFNRKYHVIPFKSGAWNVVAEGSIRAARTFDTKEAALTFAKSNAKTLGLGQVVVHGRDGRVSNRISY